MLFPPPLLLCADSSLMAAEPLLIPPPAFGLPNVAENNVHKLLFTVFIGSNCVSLNPCLLIGPLLASTSFKDSYWLFNVNKSFLDSNWFLAGLKLVSRLLIGC